MFLCFNSSNDLKAQMLFVGSLITIHPINVTLTYFNSCHYVTYKTIFHLCKFNEIVMGSNNGRCKQIQAKSVGHKYFHKSSYLVGL